MEELVINFSWNHLWRSLLFLRTHHWLQAFSEAKPDFRVPTHLKKSFSILFQYLSNNKLKTSNTISSLHFLKFLIMKLNFTHCINNEAFCLQWNSAQLLQISFPFRISILFQYLMHILVKFNTFSRSWKPILKFDTFSILPIPWEPAWLGRYKTIWNRCQTIQAKLPLYGPFVQSAF